MLAGGLNIARKLSMASICLFVLSGDLSVRIALANAHRQWIIRSSTESVGISSV